MNSKIEIIVFSHVSGKVESINCANYWIKDNGVSSWVNAVDSEGKITAVIPWNRVKQININK